MRTLYALAQVTYHVVTLQVKKSEKESWAPPIFLGRGARLLLVGFGGLNRSWGYFRP